MKIVSDRNIRCAIAVAVTTCMLAAGAANAGLVAKWNFNDYDPSDPTSAAILAPDVGSLAAIPCTGSSSSTEVTDGTLGPIYVVNTGLPEGDYALAIPRGAHVKIPLPAGIVRDKSWSLRLRFLSPGVSANKLRTLVCPKLDNPGWPMWVISGNNLVQGVESLFGTSAEENQNSVGNIGSQKTNGAKDFRLVSSDTWHSFTAHFGPTGASSTLDGYRSVSNAGVDDLRTQFTGDGFIICGGNDFDHLFWISSVEVWEDTPLYNDANGGAYIPQSSRTLFANCSLNDIRDMYITVKGLGSWAAYGRVMSSWEHVVTTDGEGNVTDLKIDLRDRKASDAILCDFKNSGADVAGNTLRDQWSLSWPNPYFTASGEFTSTENYQTAPTSWNGGGYSAYNAYALPFRPLDGSLTWSMQMGSGKFGNPVFTIVGSNPTLTFDAAPQADSITLDCGRGDGMAAVTFAYAFDNLKEMSALGGLNVGENVSLTLPLGVSVSGAVALEKGARLLWDAAGAPVEDGQTLFTATGGITIPDGKSIGEVALVDVGTVELADGGTKIVFRAPPPNAPITAAWTGGGDRAVVNDPLNWNCWNYYGVPIEGAVPNEFTTIAISGDTTFNFPAGQSLTYKRLTIDSCTLAGDCDWSGIGATLPFVADAEVDMNGHKLTVGGLGSENEATIRNEAEGDPCELRVITDADSVNAKVLVEGNVRFVKDGAGRFTSAMGQTYTGGNELLGGMTYVSLNATQQTALGKNGNEILVRGNATLELGGQAWFTLYTIVLDGGTLSSSFSENLGTYSGGAVFGNTKLLSDSTFQTVGNGNLRLWSGRLLDLGEHTLSVNLADSTIMLLGSDVDAATDVISISNGTFAVTGGTFRPLNYKGTIEARTANMRMNCAMNINDACTLNVGGYEALYEGESNAGQGAMNVYGVFRPVASGFYGCRLMDGATLDLSAKTGTWSTKSSFAEGSSTVKFEEGANVTVNLNGRADINQLVRGENYVVAWNEADAPAESVKFTLDDATGSRALMLARDAGGLKLASTGIMILVR